MVDKEIQPEFKPGETPHCVLGGQVLNGHINWQQTLIEVLKYSSYSLTRLAEVLEVEEAVLQNLLRTQQSQGLRFKAGARLLSIHYRVVPGTGDE